MQGSLKKVLKQAFKEAFKQAFKQALKQALEQAFNRQRALMQTRSDSVYSTGITAGSKNMYRSISGRQPYIVP